MNLTFEKSSVIEFDDLESFEHTKYKPLSASIAVEYKTRRILGLRISRMPAKGLLAARSRQRYGLRPDGRKQARSELFTEIKDMLVDDVLIKTDEHPHYGPDIAKHFPGAKHETHKSRRGCVVGQGELKSGGFDPLFSVNHSLAMFRANVNRLFRRSWNTTKIPERLGYHMAMYALYHNLILIKRKPEPKQAKTKFRRLEA